MKEIIPTQDWVEVDKNSILTQEGSPLASAIAFEVGPEAKTKIGQIVLFYLSASLAWQKSVLVRESSIVAYLK